MLKHVFSILLCVVFAQSVTSQTLKYVHVPQVEAPKLTAERETQSGSNFADMESRLQHEQIARMVTERQAQLRHSRRRRTAEPSLEARLSITLSSMKLQRGHFI